MEGPTHKTKIALQQTTEDNLAKNRPAKSESAKGSLDEHRRNDPIAQQG